MTDPRFAEIESHRTCLMRYALARLRFMVIDLQRRAVAGRRRVKREILGEETDAICKDEGITAPNCRVILHRGRLALRACQDKGWFGKEAARVG